MFVGYSPNERSSTNTDGLLRLSHLAIGNFVSLSIENMTDKQQRFRLASLTALLVSLAACGGGGDGDGKGAAGFGDPIDAYMGTMTSVCRPASGVSLPETNAPVYRRTSRTLDTKITALRATGSVSIAYYGSSDCAGSALYTLNLTGEDNFLAIEAKPADMKEDMVIVGTGVYFPNIAFGESFTFNGLTFTGAPYTGRSPEMVKDLLYIDSAGNVFTGDRSKPMNSQGYPSALSTMPSGKKG